MTWIEYGEMIFIPSLLGKSKLIIDCTASEKVLDYLSNTPKRENIKLEIREDDMVFVDIPDGVSD